MELLAAQRQAVSNDRPAGEVSITRPAIKGEGRMHDHASGGTVEQRRSVLTTLALGLSTFLILFDVTAVVVAMPAIAWDVGLDVAGLAWVIDAYSLAFTRALPPSRALCRPLTPTPEPS